MRPRHLLVVLATCLTVLAGCGESRPASPTSETTPSPAPSNDADVRVVAEDDAQLLLWVSNQSFVDDPVRITIAVDGVQVIDQDFDVEGQHNWRLFPLSMPTGRHEIEVTSGTGAALTETFRTDERGPRYAVVDYWNYEDAEGRFLDWRIQDDPVAFA